MIFVILKEKKFWASLFFVIGSTGMMTGNDFLPADLQLELTNSIVYVASGLSSLLGFIIGIWSEIPFKKIDNANKGGEK